MIPSRTVILSLAAAVAAAAAPGSYAGLPLHFEPNRGQTDAAEVFAAKADGVKIGLEPAGASLRFKSADVRLTLSGANPKVALIGQRPLPGRSNYLRGADPGRWVTAVPHFAAVKAAGVYPGIDVVYYGAGRSLEYDFNAAAGSDPARIEIAFGGIDRMRIDRAGDLVLDTAAGEVRQRRPLAWQNSPGGRTPVRVAYEIRGRNRIGFDIARYDRTRPLVIDPVLVFATYLGGPGIDDVTAIALDRQGNIYVTGRTNSTKFPTTAGSYQQSNPGGFDLFVTKLNPSGTALIYSTYVGSGGTSEYSGLYANGIAVDWDGNAYVIGSVSSPQAMPTTPDAMYKSPGSNSFLFKLSASGSALLYSSFLPYPLGASAVAVDGNGYIYIAGSASAPDFTGTAGAFQRFFNGMIDAFVLKLDRSAKSIVWATLLGGAGEDRGGSIAVDAAGNVYVSGTTGSADFPVTTGAAQTTLAGVTDAFVAKINPTGTALLYSTFAGGPKRDTTNSMALDSAGSAYLLAYTEGAFPVTGGTAPAPPGFAIVKVNSSGTALEYSKVLVGCSWSRMAVDSEGQAILTGDCADTSVTGGAFAPSESRQGALMKVSADTNEVLYKSFLTNSGTISVTGLAVDAAGDAYVAGTGMYYVLPVTPGVFQPERSKSSSWDDREGFVLRARVGQFHGGNFLITPKTLNFKWQIGQPLPDALSMTVTAAGAPVALTVSTADTWIAADISARQTPAALNVSLRTAGLSPGKYTGSVTIASATSPDCSLSLPVQLEVIQANVITVTPASIDLTQQIGDVPVNGTSLEITSAPTGAPVTVTSSGGDWLSIRSIYSNKTPVSAWVGVDPSKVQPGTYTGKIVITSSGAANTPIEVPVKYTVKDLPPMTVSVSRIDITYVKGRPAPAAATFEVRTGDASVPIQVSNSLGYAFWNLSCTNNSRSPTTCSLSFDPNAVEARTYIGGLNVSVREGQLYRTYIPVRLNVATEHPLDMLPASVDLIYRKLASKLPDVRVVDLNSDPPAVFSLSSPNVAWLSVTWGGNKTPSAIYVQILPAVRDMNPGVYTSSFTVSSDPWGGSRTVPITLTITEPARLSVSPSSILMEFTVGQMMFSTNLFVSADAFMPVKIQHDDVPWLFPIPHETAPYRILNVSPRATEPGTYQTKLTFTSPEAANTVEVPVKLVISQPPPTGPDFGLVSLVNAASYTPGEVSPGEIVTLFGKGLGPADLVHNAPQARRFGTEAGGTRVYFDGVPAPMIYSSAGQVAAIVPYALAGSTRTEVVLEYNGNRTTPAVLAVAPTAAGLFAADASGKGNAAALNYNGVDGKYSYNSAANPIRRGGIIVLFGTGEGQTAPAGIDGQLIGSDLTRPLSDIAVEIGGKNAAVLYSGGSPDSVAGLFQINVKVPDDIAPSGAVPVRFRAGAARSQDGVTIAVR